MWLQDQTKAYYEISKYLTFSLLFSLETVTAASALQLLRSTLMKYPTWACTVALLAYFPYTIAATNNGVIPLLSFVLTNSGRKSNYNRNIFHKILPSQYNDYNTIRSGWPAISGVLNYSFFGKFYLVVFQVFEHSLQAIWGMNFVYE